MTVTTTYAPDKYAGNGSTTVFSVTFDFSLVTTNVKVSEKVDSTGVVTLQVVTTDYTISGSNVTMVTATPSGTTLILELSPDFKQDSDYTENSNFPAETLEADLDERNHETQILNETSARTLKYDPEVDISSFDPEIHLAGTASEILAINSANTGIEWVPATDLGAVTTPISVANGGIGSATLTSDAVLTGNGTSAIQAETNVVVTSGTLTLSNGATSGGKLSFVEDSDNGSNTVSLQAGSSISSNITFTLPSADGTNTQVIQTNGSGVLSFATVGGLSNVVEDTTPQLGGQLDVNGNAIGDGTRELLTFIEDGSAVNHINIENQATGSGPILSSVGDDTNVGLVIDTKGTGTLALGTSDSVITVDGSAISGTAIKDEDNMSSNSATHLATQQSIKAYADTKLANVSEDTTPQLGGDLDINSNSLVSTSNGNITLNPNGTGNLVLGNYTLDGDQSVGAGQDNFVLKYDDATGIISLTAEAAGGIGNVVEDTSPQLGGQLDVNGNPIGDGTRELITFTEDGSAVNQVNIENEATGAGPIIAAAGGDTNIDLNLRGKATGNVILSDGTDVSKTMSFEMGGATTAKKATISSSHTDNRTITLPDATDTLVGKATTDTFTNKTFDANATGNSLSNVDLTADVTGTLPVGNGGTGVTTLTDGGVLLGSGSGAVTAMGVLSDGEIIVGDGTTDPVAESGATARTSLGVAIGSDVQAFSADLTTVATEFTTASASGAASLGFKEDTDNGTNTATLIGPASTADVTLTLPAATDTLVGKATTDTLTNKTITSAANTITLSDVISIAGTSSNAAELRLAEDTDNGTHYMGIKAPAAVTADVTLILPDGDGSADQVMATNGSGVLSWATAGGGGGAWSWVSTTTLSDDASIAFTSLEATSAYRILIQRLVPASDASLYLTSSTDNGSSYATIDYQWAWIGRDSAVAGRDAGDVTGSEFQLNGTDAIGNVPGSSEYGYNCDITLYSVNTASYPMTMTGHCGYQDNVGDFVAGVFGGVTSDDANAGDTLEIDAIKFALSTGNMTSGTITVYKWIKS